MKNRLFIAATVVLALLGIWSTPAMAAPIPVTGSERLDAVIVKSDPSGAGLRVVTRVVAEGVFSGIGQVVERDNEPGDADNVTRDDLVFTEGIIHIFSENLDVAFSLDDRTCSFTVTALQATTIDGGTGQFATAVGRFDSTVRARGVFARNSDRSCDLETWQPIIEVDLVKATGTLTL